MQFVQSYSRRRYCLSPHYAHCSFALFLLALFAWPSRSVESNYPVAVYIFVYGFFRLLHSFFYATAIQPLRSISYLCGTLVLLAWLIHSVVEASIEPHIGAKW